MPAHPGGPEITPNAPQQPLPAPSRDFPTEPAKPDIKQMPDKPEVAPPTEPAK